MALQFAVSWVPEKEGWGEKDRELLKERREGKEKGQRRADVRQTGLQPTSNDFICE